LGGIPVGRNVLDTNVGSAAPGELEGVNEYDADGVTVTTEEVNRLEAASADSSTASISTQTPSLYPISAVATPAITNSAAAPSAAVATSSTLEPPTMRRIVPGSTFDSTFDPSATAGNPTVESPSTTAVWDDAEQGSILVSKDSGKPVLDEPVITGSYEVDHLDDATLEDEIPTPVGHVAAKKLHLLNSTMSGSPGFVPVGACSRECCSTFLGSSTSASLATPAVSEEAVGLAYDPAQQSIFDKYVADANVGGLAELVERWESASKRLKELIEHAKAAQEGSAAPAALSLMRKPLIATTGATGLPGGDSYERSHMSVIKSGELVVDDGRVLSPPGTPPGATGGAIMSATGGGMEAQEDSILIETTERPAVLQVTAPPTATEDIKKEGKSKDRVLEPTTEQPNEESSDFDSAVDTQDATGGALDTDLSSTLWQAQNGESGSKEERMKRKAEVDKQIADIVRTTHDRIKIIEKEGQDEVSAVETAM
jgi:hypothetical protein